VAILHSFVNTHLEKPAEMKKAMKEYRSAFITFEFELPGATPKACVMNRRFNNHATLDHLVEHFNEHRSVPRCHVQSLAGRQHQASQGTL
jgi:hypothetical protein